MNELTQIASEEIPEGNTVKRALKDHVLFAPPEIDIPIKIKAGDDLTWVLKKIPKKFYQNLITEGVMEGKSGKELLSPRSEEMELKNKAGKKSGGGRLSRSETVTVRLDPKLRYLAELASRKQRRTLSSFIEWAIENSMKQVDLSEQDGMYKGGDFDKSIMDVAGNLWDVDDADRFLRLALSYPQLLTYEEQVLWKLIRSNGSVWRGYFHGNPPHTWTWVISEGNLIYQNVRKHWDDFVAVSKGEAGESILPKWKETGTPKPMPQAKITDELEDEIPF